MNAVIIKLALRFGLAGLIISCLYVVIFGYDSASIPLHALTVTLYSAACFSLCRLLGLFNKTIARVTIFITCFFYLFTLTSIYLSSFLSSYFWSEPMYDKLLINSFSLLIQYYISYLPNIFEVVKLITSGALANTQIGILMYSLTAGFFLIPAIIAAIIFISKTITDQILLTEHEGSSKINLVLQGIIVISITVITQSFFIKFYAINDWRGEVIIDTFFSESYLPYTEPYRARIAQLDRESFDNTPASHGNGQNIVLIIVDAMRGNYVYDKGHPPPFISKMLAENKFQTEDLAYSTCSYSLCGIAGIVASKNVVELNSNNVKIEEVLKKSGYRTYSIMAGFPDWYGMKDIYQKTYDAYIDSDISPHEMHLDDLITDTLPDFDLAHSQPFFVFLRLMSTHEYGKLKPEFMQLSRYEYANRVLQADDYLRQIFAILEKKGVLKNSTIIIAGDHGDSQGEKNEYGHNQSLYHNQLHIPIFIYDETMRYPKIKLSSSLDIAPTLVDRAGLAVPAFFNGISILKNHNEDRMLFHSKAGAQYQTDRMRGVTYLHENKVYKYIYTGAKRFSISPKKEELYEITSDPEEDHNLIQSINPEILAAMKAAYNSHFRD